MTKHYDFKFKNVVVSIETASSIIATKLNAYRILLFPPLNKILLCFIWFSFPSLQTSLKFATLIFISAKLP